MTKKPYPVLAPRGQIPITHLPHLTPSLTPRTSLTQRILTPLIVCATLVILLLCVVAGIVLTVKIFGDGHALALVLRVGTGFVVVGVSYVFLMFFAPPPTERNLLYGLDCIFSERRMDRDKSEHRRIKGILFTA